MNPEQDKHDFGMAVRICALIAACIATLILIIVGAIGAVGYVTAGPRDELRSSFAYACSVQFEAAQFPAECVTWITGDDN
jgi:hypothetical protein